MNNEKGMVLVVAIMLIAVLLLIGATSVFVSNSDLKMSGNYRTGAQAFYIADAGVERARDQLRADIAANTVSQLLAARAGADNALADSSSISNFYSGESFTSDDVPYIAGTSFGAGTYRVYLTNDSTDGITSTTDTNKTVTLTSFAQGAGNSFVVVQAVVQKPSVPPFPGAIVLPGPNVVFHGGNSNASSVEGGPESAVSLTSADAEATVEANLISINRIKNYTCDAGKGEPCINNEPAQFSPQLTTVNGIETLSSLFKSSADSVITGGTGADSYSLSEAQVGTATNRKIVYVEGNATLGPVNGAGILVVTGQLILNGNFNYNGVIICIGQGNLLRNGGGNGTITGAVYVAQTRDTSNAVLTTLGVPTYNTNGGGNTDIIYDPNAIDNAGGSKFVKLSWKQF